MKIDATAKTAKTPQTMIRLAPFYSENAVASLLSRRDSYSVFRAARLALGLSKHAKGLRKLKEKPPSASERLPNAVALLALGDGSESATIAHHLFEGKAPTRRWLVSALSNMPHKRPRMLLYQAMQDPDPVVRMVSAEVSLRYGSRRARRVLRKLLKEGPKPYRVQVAQSLLMRRHRFAPDELAKLPESFQVQAIVGSEIRRAKLRSTRLQALSSYAPRRSAALAILAASGLESVAGFKRLAPRLRKKFGPSADAEVTMALALLNDPKALSALPGLPTELAMSAERVLWGFSGAGVPYNRLGVEHSIALARALEGWVVRGNLSSRAQARAMRALEAAESTGALLLARARLMGPPGAALLTAIKLVGNYGTARDIQPLIAVGQRGPAEVSTEAWRAAALLCRR